MVHGSGRFARGLAAAATFVLAAAFGAVAAPPAEAASSGLSYSSVGTWRVDSTLGRVHVDLQFLATSDVEDKGGRRYYFPGLELTLPPSTADYTATDAKGDNLPVTVEATVSSGVVVYVPFPARLYAGQSVIFDLKFDLIDMGGSTERDLRIGQDLISFPVRGFGSAGTAGSSVSVVFPAGFAVQEQFGALTSQTDTLGETVFRSGPVPDPSTLNAWFTASRSVPPADFQVETVPLGPIEVTLRYWTDDPGWANQVARVLLTGYPVLRSSIGLGDPQTAKLTIQEATTQGIGGLSGEYDVTSSLVQISYFADPSVILHEVAHLWFNDSLASDRWIDEGFASYYAEEAVLQLGLDDHAPALGPSLMAAAEPLNSWTSDVTPGTATEAYLYGASLQAARAIATQAGDYGLANVWTLARARTSAYAEPSDPYPDLPPGGVTDWRRLLDYLEAVTGKSYTAILKQWVVTPAQATQLSTRTSLRTAYAALRERAGAWSMPPDLRAAMGTWQFGTAQILLDRTQDVLSLRDEIAAVAPAQGTAPPDRLGAAFQRDGVDSALREANLELQALDAIASAARAKAQSQGAVRVVGLLGADPDAELADARVAFAKGDVALATSLATSARSSWSGATGAGQLRILGTLAGIGGGLLLLAIYIWTRAGKRRSEAKANRAKPVDGARRDPAPEPDA